MKVRIWPRLCAAGQVILTETHACVVLTGEVAAYNENSIICRKIPNIV